MCLCKKTATYHCICNLPLRYGGVCFGTLVWIYKKHTQQQIFWKFNSMCNDYFQLVRHAYILWTIKSNSIQVQHQCNQYYNNLQVANFNIYYNNNNWNVLILYVLIEIGHNQICWFHTTTATINVIQIHCLEW